MNDTDDGGEDMTRPDETAPGPGSSFAAKLAHLIEQVRCAAGPLSYKTIAAGITELGGPQVSAAYLQQLATGRRDNPKISYVQVFAEYFNVPVSYFFDNPEATRTDSDARVMAMRAESLSDEGRQQVMGLLDYVWRYEQSRRGDRK